MKLTKAEQKIYDKCLGQCTQCFLAGNCKLRIKIRELRVLSDTEKLQIAVHLLNNYDLINKYTTECERREKDGG